MLYGIFDLITSPDSQHLAPSIGVKSQLMLCSATQKSLRIYVIESVFH